MKWNLHQRRTLLLFLLAATAALALPAAAQDTSILKPPKGAKVALVVFEDLQCPDCRRAAPLLQEAMKAYKIPLVRYDFPLPMHNWSFDAHVMARWFDTKSKQTGNDFREYIFENQPQITRENLRGFAERFAVQRKLSLPFLVDPTGALAAKVKADSNLGKRTGVSHTPTIYVVSETTTGKPFVEVVDRSQLFQLIDQMKQAAR
jgi:protein-disulfide isomerase